MRRTLLGVWVFIGALLSGCPDVSDVPGTDPALIANSPDEAQPSESE